MTELKLKPCPFCGGKVVIGQTAYVSRSNDCLVPGLFAITHQSCGIYILDKSEEAVAERWNRRTGE